MNNRERMLAGVWYQPDLDEDLAAQMLRARRLAWRFNAIEPGPQQQPILEELLGGPLPEGLAVIEPVTFDYGWNTHFGEGTFVNRGCYFMDGGGVTIGAHVFIGPSCGFYTATHPLDAATRNGGFERAVPIVVGDNCWLGGDVTVLPGVTIGEGCVVAAGSVVTRDMPPDSLVAGVPATVKRAIDQSDHPTLES